MVVWNSNEVIKDWLNYIDEDIISRSSFAYGKEYEEFWHKSKTIVLDSIETLDYIRKSTDNISPSYDNRFQKLVDICMTSCRNDYFERFLRYDKRYYKTESLWWIDCWESIRLNNILHELNIRSINSYFGSSEGEWFEKKWKFFFNNARDKLYGKNSLPAFSFLECYRFSANIGKILPIDDLKKFLKKLCEDEDGQLILFPNSNEIRGRSLSLIYNFLDRDSFNKIYKELLITLKNQLSNCKWDQYSHTWAPILQKVTEEEIINLIISKIPTDDIIDSRWITGSNNYTRKPRYSFLFLFKKLKPENKYFQLIEPNRFSYVPRGYVSVYEITSRIIDNIIQGFSEIKDIQKKVQDDEINENYFRDLIKLGLTGAIEKDINVKWVEKERDVSSGRKTDIFITLNKGPNIPIEVKLLWRFKDSYEPIIEILEQLTQGNFGVIVVINPQNNPSYIKKYQDLEGWKRFVKDHETYISGSMRGSNDGIEYHNNLKTEHFFSDHQHHLGGKVRNATILNFFIDLRDYVRPNHLSKL